MDANTERQLPSAEALAFLGDAVYGLFVREALIGQGLTRKGALHGEAQRFVEASAQARAWQALEPHLTEAEHDLARRAFNRPQKNKPVSATAREYHTATALEALFGLWYITGEQQRCRAMFRICTDAIQAP